MYLYVYIYTVCIHLCLLLVYMLLIHVKIGHGVHLIMLFKLTRCAYRIFKANGVINIIAGARSGCP